MSRPWLKWCGPTLRPRWASSSWTWDPHKADVWLTRLRCRRHTRGARRMLGKGPECSWEESGVWLSYYGMRGVQSCWGGSKSSPVSATATAVYRPLWIHTALTSGRYTMCTRQKRNMSGVQVDTGSVVWLHRRSTWEAALLQQDSHSQGRSSLIRYIVGNQKQNNSLCPSALTSCFYSRRLLVRLV